MENNIGHGRYCGISTFPPRYTPDLGVLKKQDDRALIVFI
jgi:hypothetical protein